jgi:hypothetical protein
MRRKVFKRTLSFLGILFLLSLFETNFLIAHSQQDDIYSENRDLYGSSNQGNTELGPNADLRSLRDSYLVSLRVGEIQQTERAKSPLNASKRFADVNRVHPVNVVGEIKETEEPDPYQSYLSYWRGQEQGIYRSPAILDEPQKLLGLKKERPAFQDTRSYNGPDDFSKTSSYSLRSAPYGDEHAGGNEMEFLQRLDRNHTE